MPLLATNAHECITACRSAYNNKLLLYDPATGRSQEEVRVPRDLTSHDLIESCLMATTSTQQIYVYEDFPLSHVEWCQRQIRCGPAFMRCSFVSWWVCV